MRKLLLASVASAVVAVTGAQAAPITATGSVAIVGVSASGAPPVLIGLGTTFTFSFSLFSGGTGDLAIVPVGSALTTMSMTATNGTPVSFTADWGSFTGSVSAVAATGPATNRIVDIYALGTFTPDVGPPDLTAFDAGPMSLTFSATQTGGAGSSVSASYTIASPPAPPRNVPEPMSLALFGAGLAGLGMVARRRKQG